MTIALGEKQRLDKYTDEERVVEGSKAKKKCATLSLLYRHQGVRRWEAPICLGPSWLSSGMNWEGSP